MKRRQHYTDTRWFADQYEKTDTCWLWRKTGTNKKGYGIFYSKNLGGKVVLAHRWSYEQKYGPIPPGMFACHKCDVKNCVNPDHIFIGDAKDNARDASKKGRLIRDQKRKCKHGHEFAGANLRVYTRDGGKRRACVTCETIRSKAFNAKRRTGLPPGPRPKYPKQRPCVVCSAIFTPSPTSRKDAKTCSSPCLLALKQEIGRAQHKQMPFQLRDAIRARWSRERDENAPQTHTVAPGATNAVPEPRSEG